MCSAKAATQPSSILSKKMLDCKSQLMFLSKIGLLRKRLGAGACRFWRKCFQLNRCLTVNKTVGRNGSHHGWKTLVFLDSGSLFLNNCWVNWMNLMWASGLRHCSVAIVTCRGIHGTWTWKWRAGSWRKTPPAQGQQGRWLKRDAHSFVTIHWHWHKAMK